MKNSIFQKNASLRFMCIALLACASFLCLGANGFSMEPEHSTTKTTSQKINFECNNWQIRDFKRLGTKYYWHMDVCGHANAVCVYDPKMQFFNIYAGSLSI